MPVLHVHDQQYQLEPGPTRIGAPGTAEVPVASASGIQAIVDVTPGAGVTIRRAAADAAVRVNGVALGAEPTPLLHGDRIEVGGVELRFADDRKGGATQMVTADDVAAMAAARRGAAMPTSGTGGRLVSLVDGKEYAIPVTGLVIGREVGADVVVPLAEVSRRHAEIVPTGEGYRLTDLSTNGVLVNGERVAQSRLLSRSDVIRVGSEEFRFYADVARAAPPAAVQAPPATAAASSDAPPPGESPPSPADLLSTPPSRAAAPDLPSQPPATRGGPGHPAGTKPGAGTRRPAAQPETAPSSRSGSPLWLWILILVAIAVAALLVMG